MINKVKKGRRKIVIKSRWQEKDGKKQIRYQPLKKLPLNNK